MKTLLSDIVAAAQDARPVACDRCPLIARGPRADALGLVGLRLLVMTCSE